MSSPSNRLPSTESTAGQENTHTAGPRSWLAAAILAIAVGLVYGRALDTPFELDDKAAIVRNASIVALWPPIGTAEQPGPLNPAHDLPTSARPLVNYSFALNYHFGGLHPVGYHIVNTLIHYLNAILLWLIVRRTLSLKYFKGQFDTAAGWLALAASLLWALHPLQTEAVIYTTQRTELMVAFFYLATLYGSLRYWSALPLSSPEGRGESAVYLPHTLRRSAWLSLAVLACAAGMASKEVMVSAPFIVFLFERTFIAGSAANAVRRSWPLYIGLCATWLLLIALNVNGPRAASAGFHVGVSPHAWWFTQCKVLLIYLKLAIWPSPLLCHYELPYLKTFSDAWIYVILVLVLAVIALVLLWRNTLAGFLLTFMAALLAPTFVVPVVTEMAAERRMYLPLAAILAPFVVAIYMFAEGRMKRSALPRKTAADSSSPHFALLLLIPMLALIYGIVSAKRLYDYYDEALMWQQVVGAQPSNFVAHYNLGLIYNHTGREDESVAELQASITANPKYPNARSAYGFALITAGRLPEALQSLQAALAINPDYAPALNNMGIALTRLGRYSEAIENLEHALRIDPTYIPAHINLADAFTKAGRPAEAIKTLQVAESLAADEPSVLYDVAAALVANNQMPKAIEVLERAVKLRPDDAEAHNRLGIMLARSGNPGRALVHFRRIMQLNPSDPSAYFNSANAAAALGDFNQAAPLYEEAVRLRPDSPEARFSLANALSEIGRTREAIQVAQKGIEVANAAGNAQVAASLHDLIVRLQSRAPTQ